MKEELKELCVRYDKRNGKYTESLYEGFSLFEHFCEEEGMEEPTIEEWEKELKNEN